MVCRGYETSLGIISARASLCSFWVGAVWRQRHLCGALALLLLAGCAEAAPEAPEYESAARSGGVEPGIFRGAGYARGDSLAPITVYEFSDFGCRYCAEFARATLPTLEAEFIAQGKVRWIFIPVASGAYPNGAEAAYAAICAGDHFWEMQPLLLERQREWMARPDPAPLFASYLAELGFSGEEFEACYQGTETRAAVSRASRLALLFSVRAYPSFYVGGRLIEGALNAKNFSAMLSRLLAAESAERPVPPGQPPK